MELEALERDKPLKRGRKSKPPEELKSEKIVVRIMPADKRMLRALAEDANLSMAEWLALAIRVAGKRKGIVG